METKRTLTNMIYELVAIEECRAMVRDEHARACDQRMGEEYRLGIFAALEMLTGLEQARREEIEYEITSWARAARRDLRRRVGRDPRELAAVMVQ